MENSDSQILTRQEFCARYKIGQSKFFEMLRAGKLPFFRKVESSLRASVADAEAWFRSQPRAGVSEQIAA